jgi:hypothetical protein
MRETFSLPSLDVFYFLVWTSFTTWFGSRNLGGEIGDSRKTPWTTVKSI